MTAPREPVLATAGGSQATQAAIAAATAREIRDLLSQYDLSSARKDIARITAALSVILRRNGSASGSMAARYYLTQRGLARVPGRYTPSIARPAPIEQVSASVQWALEPTFTEPAPDAWENKLVGVGEKLVLDTGRDTIIDNVHGDRRAQAWARIPEPGCCWFCAMLATRGAAYRTEAKASFQSHDNCRCHAEPVFTAYEPSAKVREWDSLYATSTTGVHGMKNLQRAFREAYREKYPATVK